VVKAYRVKSGDNVAMLLGNANAGDEVFCGGEESGAVMALCGIPAGHKIALADMAPHDRIIKYGEAIGEASADIRAGEHVHTHNLEGLRGRGNR
jgi:altronate dehydratase small subunit